MKIILKNISTFIVTSLSIQIITFYNFTTGVSKVYDCNPEENCRAAGVKGYKVPDPEDCFSYYNCIQDVQGNIVPTDNSFKCQEGTYFDPGNYGNCIVGSNCTNNCLNLCQADCTAYNYENVPDFDDCSSFYTCQPGGFKSHHKCPKETPYFDGSQCSKEKYVCCECCDECSPFCESTGIQIADPYDCRSFYLCLDTTGVPSVEDRYTCKEGEYFEPLSARCEIEYDWKKCKPKCS
ncbi:hypothetical protein Avbf_15916 [Armadillidium vulgare]|nr:hypothetical protein Avbf_15916 [Armadillidium vulgare]